MKERNEISITTEAYTRKQTINYKSIRRPVAINVFINFATVSSESFSSPSKHTRIIRSRFFSPNEVRNGDISRFIVENPRSTLAVLGGISNANLNNFIVSGNCRW